MGYKVCSSSFRISSRTNDGARDDSLCKLLVPGISNQHCIWTLKLYSKVCGCVWLKVDTRMGYLLYLNPSFEEEIEASFEIFVIRFGFLTLLQRL